MKILITGGAGFIGSNFLDFIMDNNLIDFKNRESSVVVIDNFITGKKENLARHLKKINLIEEDFSKIMTVDFYKAHKFDVVFHFAALPRIQPSYVELVKHHNANVTKTLQIIENLIFANSFNTKFIYSSSSAVYGNPKNTPTKETEPVNPLSPYAFQKLEVERYLSLLADYYNELKWIALRYFNPYGPRSFNEKNKYSAYSSVIGIFLNQHKIKQLLQITGDGNQLRDFVHVKDVALANWLAFTKYRHNDIYNVGTGVTYSINKIAQIISEKDCSGSDGIFYPNIDSTHEYIPARKGEAMVTHADNSKIIKDLNWTYNSKLILEG